uniref:Uncharacterized protein n=1 Tax=Xiphophorus maculatus TaxID=8083 RepID=A0A3B5QII7_XIPMA
ALKDHSDLKLSPTFLKFKMKPNHLSALLRDWFYSLYHNCLHPGGYNTDRSHTHWYQNYSTNQSCRIPVCLALNEETEILRVYLSWLIHFHALFLGVTPEGLWPVGTYWHLETRPDELEAMDDVELKAAASDINRVLNKCHFKTIVHGDAKLANFCFSKRLWCHQNSQLEDHTFEVPVSMCKSTKVKQTLNQMLSLYDVDVVHHSNFCFVSVFQQRGNA